MPDLIDLPGFRRGAEWVLAAGASKFAGLDRVYRTTIGPDLQRGTAGNPLEGRAAG